MSKPRTTVTIDAEFLANRLEAVDRALADIRKAASEGVFGKTSPRAQPASPAGINLHLLEWKTKGSQPARDDDAWAWAFSCDEDGILLDAARQLVQEIERYEKVEIDGYELTLSGRDKNLLSRKKIGSRRR